MRRVNSVRGRSFEVGLPTPQIDRVQAGTLKTTYKGLRFCKNPFDVVLYLRLIEHVAPRTIIEFGTSEGGSAVWFRDQCLALGLNVRILSFDISPPDLIEPGIEFAAADAYRPADSIASALLESCLHPWIVIEDSAHTYDATREVLRFLTPYMVPGDYLVVEDGVVADLSGEHYARYEDGPNRAVAEFLDTHGDAVTIDEAYCDFFGPNVTYCPNGWLKVLSRLEG